MGSKYPNMEIYAFDHLDYLDIENYKDLSHFSGEMNSYMLKSIEQGSAAT